MANAKDRGIGGSLSGGSSGNLDEPVWSPVEEPGDVDSATHYYFPVEIEVRTETAKVDTDVIVAETLRRLTEGFRSA